VATPRAKNTAQSTRADPTPTTEEKTTRLRSDEEKLEILRVYTNRIAAGKPKGKSPAPALVAKFGCSVNYPKGLHDKVLERGSIFNRWATKTRPREFNPRLWDDMCKIVEDFQAEHTRTATHVDLKTELRRAGHSKTPGREALRVAKKRAGFMTKVKIKKPIASKVVQEKRHIFVKKFWKQCFKR